jgi:hypothetical protein
MKIAIPLLFSLSALTWAGVNLSELQKSWQYTGLSSQDKSPVSVRFLKRYISVGKRKWPVAEVMYAESKEQKGKIHLPDVLKSRVEQFDTIQWKKEQAPKLIHWRGDWKNANRHIDLRVWQKGKRYFYTLSIIRKPFVALLQKELTQFQKEETLTSMMEKSDSSWSLFPKAHAQSGDDAFFTDAILASAIEMGMIPVLLSNGTVDFVSASEATDGQAEFYEQQRQQYQARLSQYEQNLLAQREELQRRERALRADESDTRRIRRERDRLQSELTELESVIQNYRESIQAFDNYQQRLQQERLGIFELEMKVDQLFAIYLEVEGRADHPELLEDLIVHYAELAEREPHLDCFECSVQDIETHQESWFDQVLNFLQKANLSGRDPEAHFCKEYQNLLEQLIQLEDFNQEARSILLLAENDMYRELIAELEAEQERYNQINARSTERERNQLLNQLHQSVNRADREWMRNNRRAFMNDCMEEKYAPTETDDPLLLSSYQLAQSVMAERSPPIESIHDFFFLFCINKLRCACREVYNQALAAPSEPVVRRNEDLAPNAMLIRQEVQQLELFFVEIREQMECFNALRINYDARDYSNARHMADPSSIPQCAQEGAEDAVRLYNLKKNMLSQYNQMQCPQKLESFYRGLSESGVVFENPASQQ